jgi:hypothetical protein
MFDFLGATLLLATAVTLSGHKPASGLLAPCIILAASCLPHWAVTYGNANTTTALVFWLLQMPAAIAIFGATVVMSFVTLVISFARKQTATIYFREGQLSRREPDA